MSGGCSHCGTAHDALPRCPVTGALASRPGPCGSQVDRYFIRQWIGGGGFASVYLAEQPAIGRVVAIKMLRHERLDDPAQTERLLRESRAGGAIDHPHVVQVYDAGVTPEGLPFVVMERIEGIDLRALLGHERALSPARAVGIALQVLDAVAAAHAAGVLHRDIKPANIMLEGVSLEEPRAAAHVKLLDFGIASLATTPGLGGLTDSGATLGTPGYMAPEQLLSLRAADARADLYSVAVVLFEMLTGRMPFEAETYAQLVLDVCSGRAPPLGSLVDGLPAWLTAAVDRGLAVDRDARWPDAPSFADALRQAALPDAPITVMLPGITRRPHTIDESADTIAEPIDPGLVGSVTRERARGGFVGRHAELARIERRLAEGQPLVTLLGPGGIGKTRLAERYAATHPPATMVDLSECATLPEVCAAVLGALGTAPSPEPAQVAAVLGHRNAGTLVLDNVEHLTRAIAPAISGWIEAAPGVRFLVTSRERLAIGAEQVIALPPLDGPIPGRDPLDADAVRLLLERVARYHPGYDPAPDAALLAELVGLLDGIPLAIELAAPRLAMLGARELLRRMHDRFDALSTGDHDSTGRHRTLEAAIAWSWELLDAEERSALAQCSVFRGGFRAADAEHVVRLEGGDHVLDVLGRLRDKSMIYVWPSDRSPAGPRLGCYQSIRDFAAARLAESGRESGARTRHAMRYIQECHRLGEIEGQAEPERERFVQLGLELDNLVQAVQHVGRSDPMTGPVAIVAAMGLIALVNARKLGRGLNGAIELFEEVRHRVDGALPPHLRPRLLLARAQLATEQGQFHEGARLAELAYGGAMARGDALLAGLALIDGGIALSQIERADEGQARIERSLELLIGKDHQGAQALALARLGIVRFVQGEPRGAQALFEEALPMLEAAGKTELRGMAFCNLGLARHAQGELEGAANAYQRAVEIGRSLGNHLMEAFASATLAALRHEQGALLEADRLLVEAAALAAPHPTYHRHVIAGYRALLALERGEVDAARAQLDLAAPRLESEDDKDRWTYRSMRAVLRAMEGDAEGCARALDRLLDAIEPSDYVARALVAAQRGHVHVARALRDPAAAEVELALAEAARAPLAAPGPSGRPAPRDTYLEARLAERILAAAIARATA